MRLRPVDSAASLALRKAIMAREDVWRHAPADHFARDRGQQMIALRASRERSRSHVEPKPDNDFAQLIAKRVARDKYDVRRSLKSLVASDEDSALDARDF